MPEGLKRQGPRAIRDRVHNCGRKRSKIRDRGGVSAPLAGVATRRRSASTTKDGAGLPSLSRSSSVTVQCPSPRTLRARSRRESPTPLPSHLSVDSWGSIATLLRTGAATEISVRDSIIFNCICAKLAQLLVPLPPISEQPVDRMAYRTHIHNLDDDSLLQIFSCFRLEDEESWNLRFTWRKLAHICRRWRYLLFDSSSNLDMCLPLSALTNDSPSTNTLNHLPPLLLVIDYYRTGVMTQKDEDNVRFGLQEHGRVRGVVLRASPSSLRMCLGQMNQLFPRLRDLTLFPRLWKR